VVKREGSERGGRRHEKSAASAESRECGRCTGGACVCVCAPGKRDREREETRAGKYGTLVLTYIAER
jgi:hypothetical protein